MLKGLAMLAAAAAITAIPPTLIECGSAFQALAQRGCCRICTKGKACGDSCIARHLNCHKGRGCACNAR